MRVKTKRHVSFRGIYDTFEIVEATYVTKDVQSGKCWLNVDQEYYFDLMTWLCKMSVACAVWENFVQCDKLTERQIRALQMLKDNGLYLGEIPRMEDN